MNLNFILEAPGLDFDLFGFSRFSSTFPANPRTELAVTLPGSSTAYANQPLIPFNAKLSLYVA
jgi:hypothetical protein